MVLLRRSMHLYLQRLVVGGRGRMNQIARPALSRRVVMRRCSKLLVTCMRAFLIGPCPHGPQVLPGHLNGSPGAGGLEEIPGAPSHNMVRSDAEGYGQASIDTMDTGAGPPAVGAGRYSSEGLRGMRRRKLVDVMRSPLLP